jgi:hypothetical protein
MHAKFFPSPSAKAAQSLNLANSLASLKDARNKFKNTKKNKGNLIRKKFIIFIDIIKTKLQETKI